MPTMRCGRCDRRYQGESLIVGIQHTENECWLISGFDPDTNEERERLTQLQRDDYPKGSGIGFDPRPCSERLTATGKDNEKLGPKRVLRHLTGDDQNRRQKGLHRDRHTILKSRGGGNGLTDFFRDIEQRLIPSVFGVRVAG